jgi:hypothetical protein
MTQPAGRDEWMRFLSLYGRSRLVQYTGPAVLAVVGVVTWWSHTRAGNVLYDVDRAIIQRNLMSSVTVLAAVSITHIASSPWPEMDNASGSAIKRIRLGMLLTGTGIVTAVCGGAGLFWETDGAAWILMRDMIGWLGITLVAQRLLGENQARLVSIAWAGIAIVAGDSWRVHYPPWAWSMQGATDIVSWTIALLAFVAGFWLLATSQFQAGTD